MNTSLTIQTESQIYEVKTSGQADMYNEFAAELNIKPVKKFRDKATGIARILKIQDEYVEARDELVGDLDDLSGEEETITKAEESTATTKRIEEEAKIANYESKRQTRFDMEAGLTITSACDPKQGTIEYSLKQAIVEHSGYNDSADGEAIPSVGDIVKYIIENHKRPRSGLGVDEQYVVHNIKWFVKRGTLELISK